MDVDMYKHNSTISNIKKLESYSNILLPPTFGELASGLVGEGRMQNPEDIISFINNDLSKKLPLLGVNILITAGPTYEHIDRVRYITNYSSGKMGVSLAKVGADLGAEITLVLGPSHQEIRHSKIKIINVISAEEMYVAVKENFDSMNIGIFSAAVSDYRPVKQSLNKLKKIKDNLNIELEPTKDILSEISLNKDKSQYIVGFALETNNEIDNAKIKLKNKQLDLIVLNSLNDKGAGFMYNTNKISIIDSNNNIEHFKMKLKEDVAKDIFDKILTQRK
jgi:phosphopantothenoylcysteine decarboxylase/phosphopantothenate--cysteine ligase